jgi:tetratricopeptide (TPR) repeat protein
VSYFGTRGTWSDRESGGGSVVEAGQTQPPDPATAATTAPLLIQRLHELRRWAGQPSLRRLRQLGGRVRAPSGDLVDALPPSTVSYVLRREQLPRLDFVEAFVVACLRARRTGADEIDAALDRWQRAWRAASTTTTATDTAVGTAEREPTGTTWRTYRQLPPDIAEFTGRAGEIRMLTELATGAELPGITPVGTIEGMAGVGKTRLAVHVAHALARSGRFGAFLHVDLHGFAEDQPPADPAAVLDGLLRLIGVPAGEIPDDVSGRAALYRDRLHGTGTLVLLDDASSAGQVATLLPACPTCLVLITSRRTLALDGAFPVRLGPFTIAESTDLLARLAGPARVLADPAGAADVAAQCGELPLAIALAGRRLQARAAWTVGDLARRLRDTDHQLDELSVGGRTVGAVFSLSYNALTAEQRRIFRLLAVHPGTTCTVASAAALAGVPARRAAELLESLVDEYLLQQAASDRYALHDLLRVYARGLLDTDTSAADRDTAIHNVLRWYLNSVAAADRLVDPHHRHVNIDDGKEPVAGLAFDSGDAALSWLRAEHGNIVAAIALAAATGADTIAWQLTAALWSFLYLGKHGDDWVATHRIALDAADRAGSVEGRAWILNNLGLAYWQRRDQPAAIDCYREALELRQSLGDRDGEVVLLDNLGNAYDELGRLDEAIDCFLRAQSLAEQFGPPADHANVLNNLGEAYRRRRRFTEAEACLTRALSIQQELGASHQRFTLCSLGELYDDLHDISRAEDFYLRSRAHAEQAGDGWLTAVLWEKLGTTASTAGDLPTARERWQASAAAYADIGDLPAATRLRELLRDGGPGRPGKSPPGA